MSCEAFAVDANTAARTTRTSKKTRDTDFPPGRAERVAPCVGRGVAEGAPSSEGNARYGFAPVNRGERIELTVTGVLVLVAGVCRYASLGDVVTFVAAAVALAALARLVGTATEQLGARLGSGGAGVVQSALGNLPELFIAIFALRSGLANVVQAALVGSILANSVLVLGLAFIVGGLRNGTQHFDSDRARM